MIVMSLISCSIREGSRVRGRSSRERRSTSTTRTSRRSSRSAKRAATTSEHRRPRAHRRGATAPSGAAATLDSAGSVNLLTLPVPHSLLNDLPSPAAIGDGRRLRVALDFWPTRFARGGSARYATELFAALRERTDLDVITLGGDAGMPTRVP